MLNHLFKLKRMNELPAPLRGGVIYSIAFKVLVALEITLAVSKQYESIPLWVIPLTGMASKAASLLVDTARKLDIRTIWKIIQVLHIVAGLAWCVLAFSGNWGIWIIVFLWIVDNIFWDAEGAKLTGIKAKMYPDHVEEASVLRTHNTVVPALLAGAVAAGALLISNDVAIIAILNGYVIHQIALRNYVNGWKKVLPE